MAYNDETEFPRYQTSMSLAELRALGGGTASVPPIERVNQIIVANADASQSLRLQIVDFSTFSVVARVSVPPGSTRIFPGLDRAADDSTENLVVATTGASSPDDTDVHITVFSMRPIF